MTSYLWFALLVLLGLAVLFMLIQGLAIRLDNFFYSTEVILGKNVCIGPDWLALTPESNLQIRHADQFINVDLPDGADCDTGGSWDIRLPDGSLAHPEVQLVDDTGATLRLDEPSVSYGGGISRGFTSSGLSRDRTYAVVRVRSDRPFTSPEVRWHDFGPTGESAAR